MTLRAFRFRFHSVTEQTERKNALPLSAREPVRPVRVQSRVRPVARVLPGPRAGAPSRRRRRMVPGPVAGAGAGVRPAPRPAVLGRPGAAVRAPPAAGQVHGRDGGRGPRGPLDQRGGGQHAAVRARRAAGRARARAARAPVLLLRVQPPDRRAPAAGRRGQGARLAGARPAHLVALGYALLSV